MTLTELLADISDSRVEGGDSEVTSFARPGFGNQSAGRVELWFEGPVNTDAPAIIDDELEVQSAGKPLARVTDLKQHLAKLLAPFDRPYPHGRDQEDQSPDFLEQRVDLDLAQGIVVPNGVELGSSCRLGPGVSLHPETRLGKQVELRAGVRIESPTVIEDNTIIHANTVIGADGYGYEQMENRHRKVPQVGGVWIGSDVEIGALVTVDRATYGHTRIGSGTKIDDQAHISHNCQIGEHCLLVGRAAMAGSAQLGDHVTLAAECGVKDHVSIADNVTVAARSVVTKDIEEPGIVVSGFPAQSHRKELRQQARVRNLGELEQRIEDLEQQLSQQTRDAVPE